MNITLADMLSSQAEKRPEKAALVYRSKKKSYASFYTEVIRIADILLKNGLEKNDRVAIYLEKSLEEATSILATNYAGGVFVDINHLLRPPQVRHILRNSGAKILFTSYQRLNILNDILQECHTLDSVIVHGLGDIPEKSDMKIINREEWSSKSNLSKPHRIVENDMAAIIYTSGSTGNPKGVVLSHRNLVVGAESVSAYVKNNKNDKILSVLPFSFDYGLNQLTTSIYVGATCVLINYLRPNDIIQSLKNDSITGLGLIPPLWLQILEKDWNSKGFPHLRYITNTGGTLPVMAIRELQRRLPQTKIYPMFGLTEAFRATYLPPEEVRLRPSSIGKAIPGAEIWVLNEKGNHCAPGEEGELVQRGPHVAMGYWNDPEKTRELFRPNPFVASGLVLEEMVVYSGDRVKIDNDGYIYFVGRRDEMIKSSGYRISPTEIEGVLYDTGKVKHAVVFGVSDNILGQQVVAVVASKDAQPIDQKELIKYCAMNMASYMVPKFIEVWENLPLNPNGKLDRNAIIARYISK